MLLNVILTTVGHNVSISKPNLFHHNFDHVAVILFVAICALGVVICLVIVCVGAICIKRWAFIFSDLIQMLHICILIIKLL